MIGWLIFGGVVMLVIILVSLSVNLKFIYDNDIDFKITYFIFTLYPLKPKKVKKSKKKNKIKTQNKKEAKNKKTSININTSLNKSANNNNQEKNIKSADKAIPEKKLIKEAVSDQNEDEKKSAVQKFDMKMIRLLIESFAHPFGRLLKKVRFNNIYVKINVRADNAAAVAINYGIQSMAVSSLLAYIDSVARVNVKEIKITPDFEEYTDYGGETEFYVKCKIKIKLASLLLFAAVSIWRYIKNNANENNINNKSVKDKRKLKISKRQRKDVKING